MSNELKINYKDYPEYMFAMIAAYLPDGEGSDLRRVSGSVVFRHEDHDGWTYKNGVLHSYDDKPAGIDGDYQAWYKYGKLHREGDLPAFIDGDYQVWYKYGERHRDGDLPAVISSNGDKYWYKNGDKYIPSINTEELFYKEK